MEQAVQPVLDETFAKDTPGMHGTQEPAAAAEAKPAGQAEHTESPEAAKKPAWQAVHTRLPPPVACE